MLEKVDPGCPHIPPNLPERDRSSNAQTFAPWSSQKRVDRFHGSFPVRCVMIGTGRPSNPPLPHTPPPEVIVEPGNVTVDPCLQSKLSALFDVGMLHFLSRMLYLISVGYDWEILPGEMSRRTSAESDWCARIVDCGLF